MRLEIHLDPKHCPNRVQEPVTRGVPFPKGSVSDHLCLRLAGPGSTDLPLQTRVLNTWPDGSARWVLCDWFATTTGPTTYTLTLGDSPRANASPAAPTDLFQGGLTITDTAGNVFVPQGQHAGPGRIEETGPIRTCLLQEGTLTHNGTTLCRFIQRTHYFTGTKLARIHLTIHNPKRAEHPGGLWDLGDAGSILFQDASFSVAIPGTGAIESILSTECTSPAETIPGPIALFQESSGGDNWKSTNHLSRSRTVPLTHQGYKLNAQGREQQGRRATPRLTAKRGTEQISLAMPYFWQNFPKACETSETNLTLRLFPKQSTEPHEIQGGEMKTHVFYIALGADPITPGPLDWAREPLIPVVDPKWIEQCQVVKYITAKVNDPNTGYQALVNQAIEGPDTFERKREVIDEYGWRHFGDIYGDHEAILHQEYGPRPRASHYNNQYDCVAGFGYQWLRTGDARWYRQMDEKAFHVRDIDLYNTDADKSAYNHGLFWHTYHYVDADTGTHRSYPKLGKVPPHNKPVPGGGPGNEQNYAGGLMLHYYLTGDPLSRASAQGMADWVINMDDGRTTVFKWLCKGPTGVASASRTPDYHGPGRGSANSLNTLIDAHRLTGEQRYLDKAQELITRVIHPQDDIDNLIGMRHQGKIVVDAENRWFYVMFLQALGKFLDHKNELCQYDGHYALARESLLHYTRWMLDHERPYLDQPEILEYPTETWVAQDMRKCEIYQYAAMHTTGTDAERYRTEAARYFKYVVDKLSTMETKSLCRPVVLLMAYGWSRAWHAAHTETRPGPAQGATFLAKKPFTPQKTIAMKRAKMLVAATAALGFCLVVGLVAYLVM